MSRRSFRLVAAMFASIALGGVAVAAPVRRAPVPAHPIQRDWTRVVAATPEGGYRLGNPAASFKLVEFGSLSCPHCAAFSREATATLKSGYIKSGRLSWEFRPQLLFPPDVGASMLLLCHGAPGAFPLLEDLYATQDQWAGKLKLITQDQANQLSALPLAQQIPPLAHTLGLDTIFQQHGMSAARVQACLKDPRTLKRVLDMTNHALRDLGVNSTPTFFINGKKQEGVFTWAKLQPLLERPGG